MKIVITEDKLYKVFVRFMDSQMDLSFDIRSRELIDKDVRTFGWINNSTFLYNDISDESRLRGLFGKRTNRMLLTYLRDRFPGVSIYYIE